MKLTPQDIRILSALGRFQSAHSGQVAHAAHLTTMSIAETAARHLIKLTKMGLAEQTGTRMFPTWAITPAGRAALQKDEQSEVPA